VKKLCIIKLNEEVDLDNDEEMQAVLKDRIERDFSPNSKVKFGITDEEEEWLKKVEYGLPEEEFERELTTEEKIKAGKDLLEGKDISGRVETHRPYSESYQEDVDTVIDEIMDKKKISRREAVIELSKHPEKYGFGKGEKL